MFIFIIGRDRYSEILMTKWVSVFDEIFADDNYTPILAEGEREYQNIVSNFPCADDKQERVILSWVLNL